MYFPNFRCASRTYMIILSFLLAVAFTPAPASAQMVKSSSVTDLKVRIPISAGWRAFTDEEWQETVTGIAGVRAGVELYPVREGKSPEDGVFRLYGRAMLCWRAGAGNQGTYKALYNGIGIQPQVLARLNITRQHGSGTAGQGLLFAARSKGGYGVKNTIGVSASGGDISVYFNGNLETTFRDTASGGTPALSTGGHDYIVELAPDERLPSGCVEVAFSE